MMKGTTAPSDRITDARSIGRKWWEETRGSARAGAIGARAREWRGRRRVEWNGATINENWSLFRESAFFN